MGSIIGDVGGTNARYATLQSNGAITNPVTYKVTEKRNFLDALADYRLLVTEDISSVAIAAAGPVLDVGGSLRVAFTNSPWVCDQRQIAKLLNLSHDRVTVLNDFQAAAYALTTLTVEDFLVVQQGEPSKQYPKLIVGPGTGLGIGRLTPNKQGGADAWATEGGHGIAVTANEWQASLVRALIKHKNQPWVTNEELYSFGTGLPNLHLANHLIERGKSLVTLKPETITEKAREGDPLCAAAINEFCFGLGVMTGHKALDPLSYGGIYLMGVHQKLGTLFDRKAFLEGLNYNDKPELIHLMPIYHVLPETPAFAGLKYFLEQRQKPGGVN